MAEQLVRYWHPYSGGWHFGIVLEMEIDDDTGDGIAVICAPKGGPVIHVPEKNISEEVGL